MNLASSSLLSQLISYLWNCDNKQLTERTWLVYANNTEILTRNAHSGSIELCYHWPISTDPEPDTGRTSSEDARQMQNEWIIQILVKYPWA